MCFLKFVSHVDTIYTKKVRQKFINNRVKPQRLNGSNVNFFYFFDGHLDAFLEAIWSLEKASWRRSGGLLEAFWEPFGTFWGLFGPSWGHLGRFIAQEAPKNRETRFQDTASTRRTGPRWPPGGPKEGPTYPQESPQTVPKGFKNDI